MKRSLPWAVIAIAPFAALLVLFNDPGIGGLFGRHADTSPFSQFMAKYWWLLLLAGVGVHAICYAVAAMQNVALPVWRRILWSVAMVFGAPFIVPVYWWLHSEPAPRNAAA